MFYENLKKACKARNMTVTALLKKLNMGTANGTFWKNGSSPNSDVIIQISEFLGVPTDHLLKDKYDWFYYPKGEIEGLYFFARYYLGKEDTDIMFNISGIDISQVENKIKDAKPEDEIVDSKSKDGSPKVLEFPSDVKISDNAFKWISAHCDLPPMFFHTCTPIDINTLIAPRFYYDPNPETLEDVLKTSAIAEMEKEFLKRKHEKYSLKTEEAPLQKKQEGLFNKQYEGLMKEIIEGYEEVIYQFGGDIGSQFVLLDRFRQTADKLAQEISSRKELA